MGITKKATMKASKKDIIKKVKDQYKIKFFIYGYGKENCIQELTKKQLKYWKQRFDCEDCDATQELRDHLWDYEYDDEIPKTHFGKWYDQNNVVHAEKAFYDESSILNVVVFKNGDEVETIEIPVVDKKLKLNFYDEFVPTDKTHKGKAYLYAGATNRGGYCEGEHELADGEKFDRKKLGLNIGRLFGSQFVWDVCYDGESLMDDGCIDSIGKGFDAEIIFL